MRVLEHLLRAVRAAAVFNPEVHVAPACILWPDRDRQWESVIPLLQAELPELLILGDYAPDKRIGPAIWLRCVIASKTDDVRLPKEYVPIFYLPGVSRQDLRAVESCPELLKPLAELQYRGVIWSQINAKDWTILAYLKSDQGGLGLDVAQDNAAKNAMQLALYRLLDEEVELLKGKRLDKDYFNTLLTGGDPIRDLLQWLNQGDAFRDNRGDNEWKAFVEVCKSQLAFNPQKEGVLAGAAKLAAQEGPWRAVWDRFCEAPKRYPYIPAQIRKCQPPNDSIFWHASDGAFDGWPQWNEDREKALHQDLEGLGEVPVHEARKKILDLEKQHGHRRKLVWAELYEAPLACALEHLAVLAEVTKTSLAVGTIDDLTSGYCSYGWKADDAVMKALAYVETNTDFMAVSIATRALYLTWAEESARHLQKIVDGASYPGGTSLSAKSEPVSPGECILFVDGLRFDVGKQLAEMLERVGLDVVQEVVWCPLPSVTGTGKPAVAPITGSSRIAEEPQGYNFELFSSYHLHKAIEENGYQILAKYENGEPQGRGWCEFGDIDHEGHDRGWKLAKHIDGLLSEIADRIAALISAGWERVKIVTDHGWLLLPVKLPDIKLPSALVDTKWGRCASLKPGASTEERLYPWFWNIEQHFALADGISCFKKGEEYAHGGLSLQECLILQFKVSQKTTGSGTLHVEFTDVVWKGLRCTVAVDGEFSGLRLDIRTQPGNSLSSVAVGIKPLKDNGTASVVVEDEDMEGRDATLVLIDTNDALMAQVTTIIGGKNHD